MCEPVILGKLMDSIMLEVVRAPLRRPWASIRRLRAVAFDSMQSVFLYEKQVNELKTAFEKLEPMAIDVQVYYNNVHDTEAEKWLKSANEIESAAVEIFQCYEPSKNNLKSRYRIIKEVQKAKKKIEFVIQFQRDGKFKGLGSRISTMDQVVEALKDNEIKSIGIWGEGGVGKTTMVKEVGIRAKEDNLFEEVVMVTVSQPPDLKRIQHDIAKSLGLKLEDQESLSARAGRLHARLRDAKRILIILDDVSQELDLKEVGIPFGRAGCKILLTSRLESVCTNMRTQKIIRVEVLLRDEAWQLFKASAGNYVDNRSLQSVAKSVAENCGGLPLALVTLGRALGDKDKKEFKNALEQQSNITEAHAKVHQSLQLSYNELKSEEAKSIFLLCCLFQKDFDISLEYLVRYGIWLPLFKHTETLAKARKTVREFVTTLISCNLLLPSDKEGCVKMHHVVRDFGISIAFNDDHGLTVRNYFTLNEWQEQEGDINGRYISIILTSEESSDAEIPKVLSSKKCPNAELLQLVCKNEFVSAEDKFFEGMGKLKVIDMSMYVKSLPSSLNVLTNLQTLCVEDCKLLEDVSIIGELVNLEILRIVGCDGIRRLPEEIGRLTNLRLLDLSSCPSLQTIAPGVISSLVRLEELYMTNRFDKWEDEEEGEERSNASLRELESLSHLNSLEIQIQDLDVFPRNLHFGTKLTKYRISIGEDKQGTSMKWQCPWSSLTSNFSVDLPEKQNCMEWPFQRQRGIKLQYNKATPLTDGFPRLFKNAECLILEGNGLKNAIKELARKGIQLPEKREDFKLPKKKKGFRHLKDLSVGYCGKLHYLVKALERKVAFPKLESLFLYELPDLKEICRGKLGMKPFGKLRYLELHRNARLGYLFSLSIAGSLKQLEKLTISECYEMETVFKEKRNDGKSEIRFPNLKDLKLEKLKSLTCFCEGVDEIYFPQLRNLYLQQLPKLKSFCFKQTSMASADKQSLLKVAFPSLEVLELDGLNLEENLREQLPIEFLHTLRKLTLRRLPKLVRIYKNDQQGTSFRNLTHLTVDRCGILKNLFSTSMIRGLVHLRELIIDDCSMMEEIIAEDKLEEESTEKIIAEEKQEMGSTQDIIAKEKQKESVEEKIEEGERTIEERIEKEQEGRIEIQNGSIEERIEKESIKEKIQKEEGGGIEEIIEKGKRRIEERLEKESIEEIIEKEKVGGIEEIIEKGERSTVERIEKESIEEIIEKEEGGGIEEMIEKGERSVEEITEKQEGSMKTPTFPVLKYLILRKLPSLRSFCGMKYGINFPLLETITVQDCAKIEFFSGEFLSTPKLKGVDVGQHDWIWMGDLNTTIRRLNKVEKSSTESKDIALGVATVAFGGFRAICWDYYNELFPKDDGTDLESFKASVFRGMTNFVLSVYDMEDFEHVVNMDTIKSQCDVFSKLWGSTQKSRDELIDIFGRKEFIESNMIREQDIGSILKMDGPSSNCAYAIKPSDNYINLATECMKKYRPMMEEGKMHLWKELKDQKCFCTVDACYVESWREINIQDLKGPDSTPLNAKIEDLATNEAENLVSDIHTTIYELAARKIAELLECQDLVVFPLKNDMFGKWKDEVIEVVRCAEIERRDQQYQFICQMNQQNRSIYGVSHQYRFVGVNHLLSCLHRTRIRGSIEKLKHLEPSVEPTTQPVYHIYKAANDLAGDGKIGLEHLYLAIVFGGNGTNRTLWEDAMKKDEVQDFLTSVKDGEGKSSGYEGEASSEGFNLWSHFLQDDGGRREIDSNVLEVLKNIKNELEFGFNPLEKVKAVWWEK